MVFESIYTLIIANIQKYFGKSSGWITDSVIYHIINNSKHNPLAGSSYIKLLKELRHQKKGLINIQNINDNKGFKWWLVRYLHPRDHCYTRIRKIDKLFGDELDVKI